MHITDIQRLLVGNTHVIYLVDVDRVLAVTTVAFKELAELLVYVT